MTISTFSAFVLCPSHLWHMTEKECVDTRFENAKTIGSYFYGLLFFFLFLFALIVPLFMLAG